jgi:hypothetical protein
MCIMRASVIAAAAGHTLPCVRLLSTGDVPVSHAHFRIPGDRYFLIHIAGADIFLYRYLAVK